VPEIASREHLANWPQVSAEALGRAGVTMAEMEVVAATRGPGLVGALLVGLSVGRAIAFATGRPFHAVHHLEGHLYSPFLHPVHGEPEPAQPAETPPERFVGLVVSGGHTSLFAVEGSRIETLAETRDDAMGEVFDKVGKRLGLPFPAGAAVDALAERGDGRGHTMPIGSCGESLDFSFSGLKSRALLDLDRLARSGIEAAAGGGAEPPRVVLDLLAGFRAAAVGQLLDRVTRLRAARRFATLAVSGGVAANRLLRRELTAWAARNGVALRLVALTYSGDNAAMIAHAALLRHRRGEADDPRQVEAASRIALEA
jgi:N6-L-threonylcarbamoyladenine synthase